MRIENEKQIQPQETDWLNRAHHHYHPHTHVLWHLDAGEAVLLGVFGRGGEHARQRGTVGDGDRGPVTVVNVDNADLSLYGPLHARPVPLVVDELGRDLVICGGRRGGLVGWSRTAVWRVG